ncbi:Hydrogenase transcriptional regulatory protein HoxA [Labilithrix luteola]|uniref:Hydrogenase transcriptional regulatory protein HoxA n=1 Tax=Labilithrix luteola TaxID=1391654 RepID=A0A0K1PPV3_9BACT|nr:Hydrogenase transcriptional regulatory protein HoxA [Labilithrix luteola]
MVVDDDPVNLQTFKRVFRKDFRIQVASSGAAGLALLQHHDFDVALVDFAMPEMNGLELLLRARTIRPDMGRIIVTGHAGLEEIQEAAASGLLATVILKPWTDEAIMRWVTHHARLRVMKREIGKMKASLEEPEPK